YEENSADWNQAFMEKLRYQYALEDTKGPGFIRKPSLTFADSLRLDLEDMVIEMKHFGICHSKSDLLIYVPELKLLFTGDLFFKYGRPSINYEQNRDKAQWLSAVQWIQARTSDIETIIGGHGELLSKEDLTRFTQLIIEE
ncbi:MAG TPA: MBL fold metallo-hydrolase, partial [Bacteroidales bacterium]|nr:MBL fold metallo-hydrolase [Bacteroidales bacterium]